MDIAFLFIAEAYQCFHGAAIALELAARPGARVVLWYNDPATPAQLERVRAAFGAPALELRRLRRSPLTRALQAVRFLGLCKPLVLWDNRAVLNRADAIVTVEDTVWLARRLGMTHPKLVYSPHGTGDRAVGFTARVRAFDLVLLAGPKTASRMLDAALIRPDNHAVTGSVKMETAARLRTAGAGAGVGARTRPIVLYAPHKAPGLSSWRRFIGPMLEAFAAQDEYDLIVAPHVKMFHRRGAGARRRWERRGGPRILIDTGSDRAMDATYTLSASLYVGDVSSQVYEFLTEPRPCVFLNAHRLDWRDDPNFAHWHLGDVIEEPAALMPTLQAASARHHLYRDRQIAAARASLGQPDGSATRAARAIVTFLART
jgi:hypothetical protein